jgi:hypothetical protein
MNISKFYSFEKNITMINRILSICLFGALSFSISAQTFEFGPDEEIIVIFDCVEGTHVEEVVKGTVTNLLNSNNNVTWERTDVLLPVGWDAFICDVDLCWNGNKIKRDMVLTPNQSGDMDVHVNTRGEPGDSAIIQLCLYLTDDTTQSICYTYRFYCSAVSTESVEFDNQLSVFPNPAKDFIQIENPYFSQSEKVKIELVNMNGQVLKSDYANGENTSFSISEVPTGTYIVRISSDMGVVNKRVMIR